MSEDWVRGYAALRGACRGVGAESTEADANVPRETRSQRLACIEQIPRVRHLIHLPGFVVGSQPKGAGE